MMKTRPLHGRLDENDRFVSMGGESTNVWYKMAIPFIFCCFFENAAGKLLSFFEMGHIFLLIRFSPWIEDLTA